MTHICDATVVCCIDFRFQKYIQNWTNRELRNKTFDMVGFAGSTKDLKIVLKQIDVSVRLHHVKEIHLIHHEECGAYGKESTPTRHFKDLKRAKSAILKKYPHLKVYLYYLSLRGRFKSV